MLICGLVHTHTKLAQQPAQFFACTISTAVLTCEISTVVLDHNAHRALYKRIFQWGRLPLWEKKISAASPLSCQKLLLTNLPAYGIVPVLFQIISKTICYFENFQNPFTKLVGWSTAKLLALRAILKWEIMHDLLNDIGRINTRTGLIKEKTSALRFIQHHLQINKWLSEGAIRKFRTLFCREFHYCRIYAFFVLILGVQKCACAIFYAFCMSERRMQSVKR